MIVGKNSESIEELNKEIACTWEKKFGTSELFEIYPSFIPEIDLQVKNRILYVGLNPAYQGDINLIYEGDRISSSDIINLSRNDAESRKPGSPKYYAKFYKTIHDFHSSLDTENKYLPDHYDLFPFRRTDSKSQAIKSLIYDNKGCSEFTRWCISIFLRYLRLSQPSLIIVNNAVSSSIIKSFLFQDVNVVPDSGVYKYSQNDLVSHFFFTGTWQYGRLDLFTKDIFLAVLKRFSNEHL